MTEEELGLIAQGQQRWRERWYGSDPMKGSAIVTESRDEVAVIGGDEETHKQVRKVVMAHNAAIDRLIARHRLERFEPVRCQYPVHGSVTHVRNVECCDFCGHPADTTPLNPVAEIERLREAAKALVAALESDKHYFGEEYNALRAALGDAS
ncbi:hypothetical protein [Novosphingobium sp. B1]|uniref:hypothetical protein n=1 Tax=Novosphingobium sp. B1 TaxID=1938756 RepID=UPI0009D8ACFC|nr:hypothetical protein [Novosphingobium sp. B1]SMC45541.1 hypothetical protein SAMN06272759_1035 [Novosphingobium sp. B1]